MDEDSGEDEGFRREGWVWVRQGELHLLIEDGDVKGRENGG